MATLTLTCNHPAVVTHESGDRLVHCAIPSCGTADVIHAHQIVDVRYENLSIAAAEEDLRLDLADLTEADL